MIVACVIPLVDAISVWRGPTRHIVEERPEVFGALSFAFPVPGEGAFQLGLPDLLFFAIFLGAAARWGLRVLATWVCLVASFGVTMALAIYVDPFGIGGLPALPLSASPSSPRTPTSSGAASATTAPRWRARRQSRQSDSLLLAPSRGRLRWNERRIPLEQRHRLDVRRVREHVHRPRPREPVAPVDPRAASRRRRASSGCTRRRRSAAPRSGRGGGAPCRRAPRAAGRRRPRRAARRARAAPPPPRRRCRRRRPCS